MHQKVALTHLELKHLKEIGKDRIKDESGASAVEYGLLVALIACAIIISVQALGTSISGVFTAPASGRTIGGATS